jgi:two-component SAPR family response regulator
MPQPSIVPDGGGDRADGAAVRILVVEDESILSLFLVDVLADGAFHVIGPCATLSTALRLASDEAIDVALLDVNVGGGQVTAVADKLLERRIPFLFVTGSERLSDPRFAKIPILRKPFLADDLFGGIEAVLPARLRAPRLQAS